MSGPKKPKKEYVPAYSPDFVVGYSFLRWALESFTAAFTSKGTSKP